MKKEKSNSNIFDASLLFNEEQINALHEKVHKHETYLKDELSQMIAAANLIKTHALPPLAMEKFQSLCGHLHAIELNMMIDAILDEAQHLKKDGIKDPQAIESLRKTIANIWRNHSFSNLNSTFLHVALLTLATPTPEQQPNKKHRPTPPSHQEKEDVELAFNLLESAALLYQGHFEEGLSLVKTFPKTLQLPPITATSSPDEIALFIQEAVAASFKMGRPDGYLPSPQEIIELLEEVSTLS